MQLCKCILEDAYCRAFERVGHTYVGTSGVKEGEGICLKGARVGHSFTTIGGLCTPSDFRLHSTRVLNY